MVVVGGGGRHRLEVGNVLLHFLELFDLEMGSVLSHVLHLIQLGMHSVLLHLLDLLHLEVDNVLIHLHELFKISFSRQTCGHWEIASIQSETVPL